MPRCKSIQSESLTRSAGSPVPRLNVRHRDARMERDEGEHALVPFFGRQPAVGRYAARELPED